MFREFISRWFAFTVIIVFVVNLGAIYRHPPQADSKSAGIARLIKWRDPVSGRPLDLPIDRTAPLEDQVAETQALVTLFLTGNELSELPPEIGYLTNLQGLDLSGNDLVELPPEIGNLTDLMWLYAADNDLAELSPEIGNLVKLRSLDLSGNELADLPHEMSNLSRLRNLYLVDNQMTELPADIELPQGTKVTVRIIMYQ